MGTDRKWRTKGRTRLKKTGVERRRRMKVHKKRLIALGLKEGDVRKMTSKQMRDTLKKRGMRQTRKKARL